jgi:hypothetical protein
VKLYVQVCQFLMPFIFLWAGFVLGKQRQRILDNRIELDRGRAGIAIMKAPLTKGYFIELRNRSTSRIVFSAATGDLSREAFDLLWKAVGASIFDMQTKTEADRWSQFELGITPITHDGV